MPRLSKHTIAVRTCAVTILVIGLLPSTSGQSHAQDSSQNDVDRIERRLEDVRPSDQRGEQGPVPTEARPAPGEAASVGEFVLSAVVFSGNSVFEQTDLAPLYEELLAQRVGQAEISALANAITRKYREAGYVLSRAVIPPQQVIGGVLRVDVIEGFVDEVEVVGGGSADQRVAGYFASVRRDRPLRLRRLERSVLLANDLPGVSVADSALEPTDTPGAFRLTVEITRDPVEGQIFLDNRGTPEAGPLESWTSLASNSALGLDEQIRLGLFTNPVDPKELIYVEAQYLQPVGDDGTELRLTASKADLDSGGDLAESDTESASRGVELRVSHPVLRTRARSLWLRGTLDWFDQEEDSFGQTSYDDRLRVARLGADWWQPDLWNGSLYIEAQASQGLKLFGASERGRAELSRSDAGGAFTKAELEIQRVQTVTDRISVLAQARGQLSADPLLSSEEFAVGGRAYGRGYDFGEISGDDGVAGLVELRFDGTPETEWLQRWQLYGFYDLGAVWNDGIEGKFERQSLASTGVGLRLTLPHEIFASLELAKPLTFTPDTEGDRDLRAFFTVSAQF